MKGMNRFLLSNTWENAVIFLGILSLWPKYVLRWPAPVWAVFAYVMLVLLLLVFVRRLRRFNKALRETRDSRPPML